MQELAIMDECNKLCICVAIYVLAMYLRSYVH